MNSTCAPFFFNEYLTQVTWMALEKLYNQDEAAQLLGIAPATLRRWRYDPPKDAPRYIKVGRCVRYQESELRKYIEKRQKGAA